MSKYLKLFETESQYEEWKNCSGLTSINIPDSVTTINSSTFYGCSGLTSINIPDSVTSIKESAFSDCISLTSVEIGSGVTTIGNGVFYNCSGLNEITCNAITAPSIDNSTFKKIKSNGVLKVPAGSDYSSWMSKNNYYLGYYGWNMEYILPEDAKVFEIYNAFTHEEDNARQTEELINLIYANLGEENVKNNNFSSDKHITVGLKEATGYDCIKYYHEDSSYEVVSIIRNIDYYVIEESGRTYETLSMDYYTLNNELASYASHYNTYDGVPIYYTALEPR